MMRFHKALFVSYLFVHYHYNTYNVDLLLSSIHPVSVCAGTDLTPY